MTAKSPLSYEHHIVPIHVYVLNLLALFVLMLLTIGASYVNLPAIGPLSGVVVNNIVAMGIASLKALLVVLYFMHIRWATRLTKLWVIIGFVWVTLLAITLFDYRTRGSEDVKGWDGKADTALPRVNGSSDGVMPSDPNDINVRPRQ